MEPAVFAELPVPSPSAKPNGLVPKLLRTIAEIQSIPKRGRNSFSNYAFATAEDIVAAVRVPLAKNGVLVYSTLLERQSEEIKTVQGKGAWRERIVLRFVVTDGAGTLTFDAPGEGQDSGDKAIYKAITGATKYALRQLLQLPIGGDDPEVDSHETYRAPATQKAHEDRAAAPAQVRPPTPQAPPLTHPAPPAAAELSRAPATSVNQPTERQIKAIFAVGRTVGLDEATVEQLVLENFGHPMSDMTRREASQLLDLLKREQSPSRP